MKTKLERLAYMSENFDALPDDEWNEYRDLLDELEPHFIALAQKVVGNVTRNTASESIWDRWEADGWSELVAPFLEPTSTQEEE